MNFEALILILIGVAICIFPKHVREYKMSEWGESLPSFFIKFQRVYGVIFIIIGILGIVLDIE